MIWLTFSIDWFFYVEPPEKLTSGLLCSAFCHFRTILFEVEYEAYSKWKTQNVNKWKSVMALKYVLQKEGSVKFTSD